MLINDIETKVCNTCKQAKELSEFYLRTDTGKAKSDCKACYNEKQIARKALDPEKSKASSRINAMRHYDNNHRVEKVVEVRPEPSELTKAYLAGFFDGEGSVGIQLKTNGNLSFVLSIVNSDYIVMQMAQKYFGGSIYDRKVYVNKPIGHLQVGGAEAEKMARDLIDYSYSKRPQLELFIEAREKFGLGESGIGRKGIKLTTNEIEARREYVSRLKELKRI